MLLPQVLLLILQENEIKPTVSGRAGSGAFDFFINLDKRGKNVCHSTQRIYVDKSQIEIDAGYEGNHSLALIEAKLDGLFNQAIILSISVFRNQYVQYFSYTLMVYIIFMSMNFKILNIVIL
ncbi:MAG: hypothetical protein J6574_08755 [Gilliamella sp.]|uniref:DUF6997 domain-containing protein n=1 Tax=Snodgrassella sp. TaxID=2815304 RepID=UPI002589F499|nr:hypothetical protein [Snodgrassella sp.]MCO6517999.1 hypothetical protein [Snodgrassella sp.]MCO6561171.1 hypothetical protein [Gilliamella sp.]